jgi:hypothetical protein
VIGSVLVSRLAQLVGDVDVRTIAPAPGDLLGFSSGKWRPVQVTVITDHGALSGLADDDHPQYHNDARGDARYSLLGHNHDGSYAALGHNHDHGALTGLSDDDHSIYALLAGRAGGQTLIGGTASAENLLLKPTAHATLGYVGVPYAPRATANYGLVSLGSGPFDGATAGFFVGDADGTLLAGNAASGFVGALLDFQIAGVRKARIDETGSYIIGAPSGAANAKFGLTSGFYGLWLAQDTPSLSNYILLGEFNQTYINGTSTLNLRSSNNQIATLTANGFSFQKAYYGTPVALTDAATIATNARDGNLFRVTIGADRTLGAPTNPADGQVCTWFVKASGADRTLTLASGAGGFRFCTDITGLTATLSGKIDRIVAEYVLADDRWDVVGYIKGH